MAFILFLRTNESKIINTWRALLLAISFAILAIQICHANPSESSEQVVPTKETLSNERTHWLKLDHELYFGTVSLHSQDKLFDAQLYIIKCDPRAYALRATTAEHVLSQKTSTAREMTHADSRFIAAINANFFDENKKPLGLIVDNTKKLNNMHMGGKLLHAIFLIKNDTAFISPRADFSPENIQTAVQSGPQIIRNSEKVSLGEYDTFSRRSGVAITKNNEIVFYATALRFPGTSLTQIQNALQNTGIEITDALNFDGGGSSQLYLRSNKLSKGEIFVSGGDAVPSFLILSRKE